MKPTIQDSFVPFASVREAFLAKNSLADSTNQHAYRMIEMANHQFGRWEQRFISVNEAMSVMLSWHLHSKSLYPTFCTYYQNQFELKRQLLAKHADNWLVPPEGATVQRTITFLHELNSVPDKWKQCIRTILYHSDQIISPLFFCSALLKGELCHSMMQISNDSLIHIDGLHRLISLGYPCKRKHQPIHCFVAIKD